MIKKLAASNLVPQNRPPQMNCRQTHIAITGSERTIFPFVTNIGYLNNQSTTKTYYPISVNLSFKNLNMLGMNFQVQLGYLQCKTYCYVRIGNQTPQMQLSLLSEDDILFLNFRHCLYENDYYFYGAKSSLNLTIGVI